MQHSLLLHRAAIVIVIGAGVIGTVASSKAQPKITWPDVGPRDVDNEP